MDNPTLHNKHSWGSSRHLVVTDQFDLAVASGHAGGASSLHVHHGKHNVFLIRIGTVEITGAEDELLARLDPQQAYTVPAGLPHRMQFVTDAVLYEFYYPVEDNGGIDLDDIQRFDAGWEPGAKELDVPY